MKHIAAVFVMALAFAAMHPAKAQTDVQVVPVIQAPYHLPVFKNDYITMVNIYIPPGGRTGFHKHTGEAVSVNIEASDMKNQELGEQPEAPSRNQSGRVTYRDYRPKPRIHQEINVGSTAFHNVLFIFNSPTPSGFAPSSRAVVPGYEQVLDNARVRGWRIVLGPGQSAAPIKQMAPGFRIIVRGGPIVESVPGQPERAMDPRSGEFYWQDPGITRSLRNTGSTPIEFVEFELK
jgi:hypothetical protein